MPINFGQGMPSREVCFGSGSRTEDESGQDARPYLSSNQLERFGDDQFSEPYLFAEDYPATTPFRECYWGHNWLRTPRDTVVCLGCGVIRCQVPGCGELAARNGQGCCDAHEKEEDN